MRARWILLISLVLTTAIYWLGLSGPFIFDDPWNLEPIRDWVGGKSSLLSAIFPQQSLINSRPVAMASFALTTWLMGDSSFSFKLGNLVIHLVCGLMGWAVLRRLLAKDSRLAPYAELIAAFIATFWLLHPLHVSTVLYAVQRMAQLATLFTLAALWCYLTARQQLGTGANRIALLNLFVVFPSLVMLGLLSKQNAAVAPGLCLVIELAYFGGALRRDRRVQAFFGTFLLLPAVGVVGLLFFLPQKLLATYAEWDFTLWQRLLTQSRVLVDYIGMILVPRGPTMGLYTDDYITSYGFFSPPATLFAIVGLALLSAIAIALRKRAPSFFAGWFFFLVAHFVESTFLPLEMYYEHRNYLPAMGLLLAVFGLVSLVPTFRTHTLGPRKLAAIAACGFALVLSIATLGRVLVWRDMGTIAQLGVQTHPDSLRARFDVAAWALLRKDYKTALEAMEYLASGDNPRHQQLGNLSIVAINCMREKDEDTLARLRAAAAANLPKLTTFEAQAFVRIAGATRNSGCGRISRGEIAANLRKILDSASTQPEFASSKWFSRYALAEIYARDNQWRAAQSQAEIAWRAGRDKKIGAFLATIYIKNGDFAAAQALTADLAKIIEPYDHQGREILLNINKAILEEAGAPQFPSSPVKAVSTED